MDSIDSLEMQKEELELEQMQMQMKVASVGSYEEAFKTNTAKLDKLKEGFFDLWTNEQLGAYLTDIFVKNKLSILDTTIRSAATSNIEPYALSTRMDAYKNSLEEGASSSSSTIDSVEENLSAGAGARGHFSEDTEISENAAVSFTTENVYSSAITISALGTKNQILSVLDKLSAVDGLRITSFTMSDFTQQTGTNRKGEAIYSTDKKLDLDLIIFMCKD